MSSNSEFRGDCELWRSYKPCPVQLARGVFDCSGCLDFKAASITESDYIPSAQFDPTSVGQLDSIGVIEAGGLGSIMRTTAVTRALRTLNPNIEITWFTNNRGIELLEYVPNVRAVSLAPPREPVDVAPKSPAVVLNFETSPLAIPLVRQAAVVGGFALNEYGKFIGTSQAADLQRMQTNDPYRLANSLTMQHHLLRAVGLPVEDSDYDIRLPAAKHQEAAALCGNLFDGAVPPRLLGLNIGTSGRGYLRRWPAANFVQLARSELSNDTEQGVVILSGPDDADQLNQVKSVLSSQEKNTNEVVLAPGDLEIGTFIALVGLMDRVVTANTFGFHAAKVANVPATVISATLPQAELEVKPDDMLIDAAQQCGPCFSTCYHQEGGICVEKVSAADVSIALGRTLRMSTAYNG